MTFDPQAVALNETIRTANPELYELLSHRGKAIFFPKLGILSQSAEASGAVINATIGTALEDSGSPMVLESLSSLVKLGSRTEGFGYAPSSGRSEIRSAWRRMMVKKNPSLAGKPVSLPVVTSALTHGLSMAGYLFVDGNDSIISPDRYWENYDLVFCNGYGATIDRFEAFVDNERFNVEGLREKLMNGPARKRIVILNFPNNPTGYTVTVDEAQMLRTVLVEAAQAGNSIVVFIDDSYFGLVFEKNILCESMFSFLADAHERIMAIKLDGPTKEDYVWGLRCGFLTFGMKGATEQLYAALESKLAGAIRGNISSASNMSQAMLLAAYGSSSYDIEKKEKYLTLERRYRKIREILSAHPEYREYFYPLPFNSGYFMCIRIVRGNAEAVRKKLISSYKTGTIAHNDILRLAFSSTPYALLEKLFDNCYNAARECA